MDIFVFEKGRTRDLSRWSLGDWAKLAQWINCGTHRRRLFFFHVPRSCRLFPASRSAKEHNWSLRSIKSRLGDTSFYPGTLFCIEPFDSDPRDHASSIVVGILNATTINRFQRPCSRLLVDTIAVEDVRIDLSMEICPFAPRRKKCAVRWFPEFAEIFLSQFIKVWNKIHVAKRATRKNAYVVSLRTNKCPWNLESS